MSFAVYFVIAHIILVLTSQILSEIPEHRHLFSYQPVGQQSPSSLHHYSTRFLQNPWHNGPIRTGHYYRYRNQKPKLQPPAPPLAQSAAVRRLASFRSMETMNNTQLQPVLPVKATPAVFLSGHGSLPAEPQYIADNSVQPQQHQDGSSTPDESRKQANATQPPDAETTTEVPTSQPILTPIDDDEHAKLNAAWEDLLRTHPYIMSAEGGQGNVSLRDYVSSLDRILTNGGPGAATDNTTSIPPTTTDSIVPFNVGSKKTETEENVETSTKSLASDKKKEEDVKGSHTEGFVSHETIDNLKKPKSTTDEDDDELDSVDDEDEDENEKNKKGQFHKKKDDKSFHPKKKSKNREPADDDSDGDSVVVTIKQRHSKSHKKKDFCPCFRKCIVKGTYQVCVESINRCPCNEAKEDYVSV